MARIEGAQRPFWMHQVVEYLIGVVLISLAFQLPDPVVPAILGLLVIVNAAITTGGAGAFEWIGRRLHRVLDVVVIALLVVTAFQPWVDVDTTGRIALPAIAFVLFFVWVNTEFGEPPPRRSRTSRRARPPTDTSEELGRRAGRAVGQGVNAVRRWSKDR